MIVSESSYVDGWDFASHGIAVPVLFCFFKTKTKTAGPRCRVPVGGSVCVVLVAFSCVLRRDKLDGSESWSRFGSTPNLLRSLGTRPLGRVCMLVHDGFSAPNLLRNLGSRPSFAFAIAGTRCLVYYPNSRDSLPHPLPKQPGLVALSTTQTAGTRCLIHYPNSRGSLPCPLL